MNIQATDGHSSVTDRLIQLPKIRDSRGNLTFVQNDDHIPFDIKRVYYLYDVPSGAERAGHAHKELHQLVIAVSGSFSISLDNGYRKETYFLNSPDTGLLVGPGVWRVINDFSSGGVCLVLASMEYDESDYYRDYGQFLQSVR